MQAQDTCEGRHNEQEVLPVARYFHFGGNLFAEIHNEKIVKMGGNKLENFSQS